MYLVWGWQAKAAGASPTPNPGPLKLLEGQGPGVLPLRFLRPGIHLSPVPLGPQSSLPGPGATYQTGTALFITPQLLSAPPPHFLPFLWQLAGQLVGRSYRLRTKVGLRLCPPYWEGLRMHSLVLSECS